MGTPGTTHVLTALHFHPNALTELIEEHRAMISALHILAHAVGGEMWPTLVHRGVLAAAEYGRDEIERLRAENERLRDALQMIQSLGEGGGYDMRDLEMYCIAVDVLQPNSSHQTTGGE